METAFKNKVAIITGGSSGIGRATWLSPKKGTKLLL
jgi:NADP-dependent 3-hydroxy acid dehydrogenase YdfG